MSELELIDATADTVGYTFGGREPVAALTPGVPVRVRTWDCFAGNVRTVQDLPSKACQFPYLNPVTGPSVGAGLGSGLLATAFLLVNGLHGGNCGVRQVSRTGLRCSA
ncbi:hypothetical protein AB0M36_18465 [Actinoplanes sp. NPDC051346]|uniref:hypothetical protein n=1 Tax=Actinoplanes sp. NPDC051346 TaxID=3155048 RepID=UPI0034195B50